MKWQKKPVVIEAEGPLHIGNLDKIALWCGGRVVAEAKASDPTDVYRALDIPTLEGVMRGDLGDYIIRGVKGKFYPCKPDIFEATYEKPAALPHSRACGFHKHDHGGACSTNCPTCHGIIGWHVPASPDMRGGEG